MQKFPPVEKEALTYDYFPTKAQCFVYRLWDMLSPARMAEVLECDEKTILSGAKEMGLTPTATEDTYQDWQEKGYITLIRAVWHLLPYEQICTMLHWTPEKLSFILHEDDFLDVKLGLFKPHTASLYWQSLGKEEKEKTAFIRKITEQTQRKLPTPTEKPFGFEKMFAKESAPNTDFSAERFSTRMIYSYCALYGDTFSDKHLIDESFPSSLLQAYQTLGINAVWTQAVLYTLTPFPFAPEMSAGYENRLKGLHYLIDKLKKYGIKLYLYLNEPRPMPEKFFDRYPTLKGVEEDGFHAMCVSQKEVQDYLRHASEFLVSHAPQLGGFLTITASENLTNCYAHYDGNGCRCPRCAEMTCAQMYATVNRLLWEGANAARKDFPVVAWTWGWWIDGTVPAVIDRLPQKIEVMNVSEQRVQKLVGGVETQVEDYSISVEGPGDYALSTWKKAHSTGHKTWAKIQANNTWEMAAVPCIPAFEKIYRHMAGLITKDCPDSIMLSWTLGGYPSPTLKMLSGFYESKETLPTLSGLYERAFGRDNAEKCAEAFHLLSEAFDQFPFSIEVAYNAPQHYAPANLLFPHATGFTATMVGMPYDDLATWCGKYPQEVFVAQWKKLSDGWQNGLSQLEKALEGTTDPTMLEILDDARVCNEHFRSVYVQCLYVMNRGKEDCTALIEEEMERAIRIAGIMAHNSTIGYESSNHYFYTRSALLEKVLNCAALLQSSSDFKV